MLGGQAQKRKKTKAAVGNRLEAKSGDSDNDEDFNVEVNRQWSKKDPGLVGSRTPNYVEPPMLPADVIAAASTSTAYEYYKLFQPDSFAAEIVEQSRLYGGQKDLLRAAGDVNVNTYRFDKFLVLRV